MICKYCKGQIQDDSIKCAHCGEFQNEKYVWTGIEVTPYPIPFFRRKIFCTICRYEGKSNIKKNGSLLVSFILYCLFIIPGVIYSKTSRKTFCVCKKCGSNKVNKI